MDLFYQGLLNGVVLSATYILIAIGMSLIYGVMQVVNFAHGALFMLGAMISLELYGIYGLNYWLVLALTLPMGFILGIILEKLIFYPLRRHHLSGVLASFGLTFVIEIIAGAAWGLLPRGVPPVLKGAIKLGTVQFTAENIPLVVGSIILTVGTLLLVHRSKIGRAIRAYAQHSELASLHGIKAGPVRAFTFGISVFLALAAGVLISPTTIIHPYIGTLPILNAFAVIVIGGLGSIYGAIAGGIALGMVNSFGLMFLGNWAYFLSLAVIFIVLIVRPQGIFSFEAPSH